MRVFLSFHSADRERAVALKRAIEEAQPGTEVFVDQMNLRYGQLWQPALFDAIANSAAFIILVSNQLGDWQKVEYYEARDRKAKDDTYILLPIIIADKAKGPTANLPGLTQLHWIETTEPTSPDPISRVIAALSSKEVPQPPEPWRIINPYRGLSALEEQDADFFFGRNVETCQVLDAITAKPGRLYTLIGNSGVGKSSLVQAGIIGSLKRQRWPGDSQDWPAALMDSRAWAFLSIRPGEAPIDAVSSAFASLWFADATDPERVARRNRWSAILKNGDATLTDLIETTDARFKTELGIAPPRRYFLYIDQGEELYSRVPKDQIRPFAELIAGGLGNRRLVVMTSLRSDYYGQLQANKELFSLTERIDVAPLGKESLQVVLSEPARVLKVKFESDSLVEQIVASAQDQPGALPLLADLFTDLWERMKTRSDGTLRMSDRREIIQVGAALSRRADEFLAQQPEKMEELKRLFTLRLAHVPRLGEPVRRRMVRTKEREDEWKLAQTLAGPDWRLLATGENEKSEATAEVAHEVLFKTWQTLKRWLEQEREFLVWRDEVEIRRQDHGNARSRKDEALLMGLPLTQAGQWLKARREDIDPPERLFIEDSQQRERARRRNVRMAAAAAFVMVAAFAVFAAINWSGARQSLMKAEQATEEARKAQRLADFQAKRALANQSLHLARESRQEADRGKLDTALLLSLEGLPKNLATPERPLVHETVVALAHAIFQARGVVKIENQDASSAIFAIAPDEKWFLNGGNGEIVARSLSGPKSERQLATLQLSESFVLAAVNGSGTICVAATAEGHVYFISTKDWSLPNASTKLDYLPTWLSFDPGGSIAAVGDTSGNVTLFSAVDKTKIAVLSKHTNVITSGQFSASGDRLITASEDGSINIWDVPSKSILHSIVVSDSPVWDVKLDVGGDTIGTASGDKVIRLYNSMNGNVLKELRGHKGEVRKIEFSRASDLLSSLSSDGTAFVWDLKDGSRRYSLQTPTGVTAVAFNRDATLAATGSSDGTIQLWDTASGSQRASFNDHNGPPASVGFLPISDNLYSRGLDGSLVVRNTSDEGTVQIARRDGYGAIAAFGSDENTVAVGYWSGKIEMRNIQGDDAVSTLGDVDTGVTVMRFPACSLGPIAASADGTVRVWSTNEMDHEFRTESPVLDILTDPRCKVIASILANGRVEIRSFRSSDVKYTLISETGRVASGAISGDGARLITGDELGEISLWDMENGKKIATVRAHDDRVVGIAFGKNCVLTASWDGLIKCWSLPDLRLQWQLSTGVPLSVMTVSDDRASAVTADWNGQVAVWDLAQPRRLKQWQAHQKSVVSLAYDPRTNLVLSGSDDRTAALWDASSGELLTRINHAGPVIQSQFSKTGSWIITNGGGTDLRLWRGLGTVEDLVAEARQLLTRSSLTSEERVRFSLGDESIIH